VATHASALKAHRQNLVHRERNRKYRSQLRSTLKQIRLFLDDPANAAKDQAAAKKQLNQAISLIDKMAGKGIIHRNTASRYKSRLDARVSRSA
jgi:small subunit ribosomal protein S20